MRAIGASQDPQQISVVDFGSRRLPLVQTHDDPKKLRIQ
jgi:hypothetical protein